MRAQTKLRTFTTSSSILMLEAHVDEHVRALHAAATATGYRTQLTDATVVVVYG